MLKVNHLSGFWGRRAGAAAPTIDECTSLASLFAYQNVGQGNFALGSGSTDSEVFVPPDFTNPRTVTYFNASGITAIKVYLLWHTAGQDAGYLFEKSTDNSNWTTLTTTQTGSGNIVGGWWQRIREAAGITGCNYLRITWLDANNGSNAPWANAIDRVELTH